MSNDAPGGRGSDFHFDRERALAPRPPCQWHGVSRWDPTPHFLGMSSLGFAFCVGYEYMRRWLSSPQLESNAPEPNPAAVSAICSGPKKGRIDSNLHAARSRSQKYAH